MNSADYFTPPSGFSLEPLEGLIKIGVMVQIIVGVVLIIFALLFLIKLGFNMFRGKGNISKELTLFTVALVLGITLIGNGWIKVLDAQNKAINEPAKKILTEQQIP